MDMSEIYNGSQWDRDIFLVNKAGATEYIMGRSSTLNCRKQLTKIHKATRISVEHAHRKKHHALFLLYL